MPSELTTLLIGTGVGGGFTLAGTWLKGKQDVAKFKAERDEQHFSHRQGNYHQVIAKLDQYLGYWRNRSDRGEGLRNKAKEELRTLISGITVFGTDDVRRAVDDVVEELDSGPSPEKLQSLRHDLVSAMRRDVAPDKKR